MTKNVPSGLPLPSLRLWNIGAKCWAQADRRFERIKNKKEVIKAQNKLRKSFGKIIGPLPCPENKISYTTKKQYHYGNLILEFINLESSYGYIISGWSIYRKNLKTPVPGIVIASGHSEAASLHEPYFKLALLAAASGFYVFSFDPPGQGARREIFLSDDHPVYWCPSKQHQHLGAITGITGKGLTHFFAHDCLTAVSFISQLKKVDSSRIGFTGQSGGGLQTFLSMALDPRIAVAVPCQASSTRRGAFYLNCAKDVEQTFFNAWSAGIDYHEMALLFAPKPLRIISEYGFDDQADIFYKLKPIYEIMGVADNLEIVSGSTNHVLNRPCREMVVNWLTRHLQPQNPLASEPEWQNFDSVLKKTNACVAKNSLRDNGIVHYCRKLVKGIKLSKRKPAEIIKNNLYLKNSFSNRKYPLFSLKNKKVTKFDYGKFILEILPEYRIPIKISKGQARSGISLLADENGANSAWTGKMLKKASLNSKYIVLFDVFNCGSLKSNQKCPPTEFMKKIWNKYFGPTFHHAQEAFMAGTCPVGLAIEEINAVINSVIPTKLQHNISFYGQGWPALSGLLLSCCNPIIKQCHLEGIPANFKMMVDAGKLVKNYHYIVPGLILKTDIPDLISKNKNCRYTLK